ncbi:MAG: hypothetical protein GC179_11365 [Anaerolineaceae bacterium]|nr:hypothetical protein [Anaerolineaceae bacterium]
MIWWKLFWWMTWRGVVSGIGLGALYGTILALVIGAVFGAVFGGILGLVTGIINGIALMLLTRFRFNPPHNTPQFRRSASVLVALCTFIIGLPLMNQITAGTFAFVVPPLIIAAVVYGSIARRFPAFAVEVFVDKELAAVPVRRDDQFYR